MQHSPFPACTEREALNWTPKVNETKGHMTLGHSSWTLWSPLDLFLDGEFPLHWQATWSMSLFQHAEKKWMKRRGIWPWFIQVGPFRVHKIYFWIVNFHFIIKPHAAFPFSCMQRKGSLNWTPKVNETKGHMTLGHSSWTIWSPLDLFLDSEFPLY